MPLQNICRNFFIIEQRDSISRYDSHLIITVLSVIMYTWRKPDPLTMEMQALASLECKSQSPRVSSGEECARAYVNFGKWTNTSLGSRERKKNGGTSESIMLLFLLYAICKAPFDNWSFSSWKSFQVLHSFEKKIFYRFSFLELNFNVTNHSENQASSPTFVHPENKCDSPHFLALLSCKRLTAKK